MILYKFVDNIKYLNTFPDEWIYNTYIGTGPKYCINCRKYGCIDDIFIGYCGNCSEHIYNFERGDGFEVYINELILENNYVFCEYIEKEKFKIIAYLENKKKITHAPCLYWDCDNCQSVNFNNLNYCETCKQNISDIIHDSVINKFDNMSID